MTLQARDATPPILIVPGLYNSGPDHWQSHWERDLPGAVRVERLPRAAGDMVHTWEHPVAGPVRLVASPMKFSATPVRTDLPPPLLGQHTDEVLQLVLGWSPETIAQMRQEGCI